MPITQPKSCEGCSLYGKATGFCLGSGDPTTAKLAIILEAPGSQEVQTTLTPNASRFHLRTREECDQEIATRQRDYPELTNGSIKTGYPAIGPTGLALESWIMRKAGLKREDAFVDNVLRCLPAKSKNGAPYPTGEERKAAEKHCRQYDRLDAFSPDTMIVSLHPAGLMRDIVPLPLVIKDFEKLRDFTQQGRKCVMLLGGKSSHAFLRYAENVSKWRGTYTALPDDWAATYKQQFEYVGKTKRTKKVVERPVELTESCASCKRYKGRTAPKHNCRQCWDKFQNVSIPPTTA